MSDYKALQISELLKAELADAVVRDAGIDGCLITITYVECEPDLNNARIGVSVLPESFGPQVMRYLIKSSSRFSSLLRKKVKLRKIPKFRWELDLTEAKAAEIEEVIRSINS